MLAGRRAPLVKVPLGEKGLALSLAGDREGMRQKALTKLLSCQPERK